MENIHSAFRLMTGKISIMLIAAAKISVKLNIKSLKEKELCLSLIMSFSDRKISPATAPGAAMLKSYTLIFGMKCREHFTLS